LQPATYKLGSNGYNFTGGLTVIIVSISINESVKKEREYVSPKDKPNPRV
jgi:hypothetical protein